MNESAIKMIGLATMIVSLFLILFGAHASEAGASDLAGTVLVVIGLLALLVGTIWYVVLKKD